MLTRCARIGVGQVGRGDRRAGRGEVLPELQLLGDRSGANGILALVGQHSFSKKKARRAEVAILRAPLIAKAFFFEKERRRRPKILCLKKKIY